MDNKRLSTPARVFLIIWLSLVGLIIILMKVAPIQKPVYYGLLRAFTCEKVGNEWLKQDTFTKEQSIHICGNVFSKTPNIHEQMQIRIYENEITSQDQAIYYENKWITNGEILIPVYSEFLPGTYVIQVSNGRRTLSSMKIDIIQGK